MNTELTQLARDIGLDSADRREWRLAFGLACVERVAHLLEDPRAVQCLQALRARVAGGVDDEAFARAVDEAAQVANGHRGSASLDGAAHAAVSATYAVAKALAGKALEAADYAAYATVYAYGGYAVKDPDAFAPEFAWQAQALRDLSRH
ncbi:hypothetical protein [Caenimonas aquaedulcis]|uniref:Uncharacterized protein n=1 Tax=Caenimonas aquaedulcis TaxID=2793270 RepID=A0A931MEW9_9BURK|nr:hypothetical protein [Caenimonas aquaedulcis]MBG9386689.1 hypothetical protein [Caenimonas aquaedulcis]